MDREDEEAEALLLELAPPQEDDAEGTLHQGGSRGFGPATQAAKAATGSKDIAPMLQQQQEDLQQLLDTWMQKVDSTQAGQLRLLEQMMDHVREALPRRAQVAAPRSDAQAVAPAAPAAPAAPSAPTIVPEKTALRIRGRPSREEIVQPPIQVSVPAPRQVLPMLLPGAVPGTAPGAAEESQSASSRFSSESSENADSGAVSNKDLSEDQGSPSIAVVPSQPSSPASLGVPARNFVKRPSQCVLPPPGMNSFMKPPGGSAQVLVVAPPLGSGAAGSPKSGAAESAGLALQGAGRSSSKDINTSENSDGSLKDMDEDGKDGLDVQGQGTGFASIGSASIGLGPAAAAAAGLSNGMALQQSKSLKFAVEEAVKSTTRDNFNSVRARASVMSQATLSNLDHRAPSWLKRVVDSPIFGTISLLMILGNSVYIGMSAERTLQSDIHKFRHMSEGFDFSAWNVTEDLFCGWFTAELLARFFAAPKQFALTEDLRWNMFDLALVLSCVIETLLRSVKTLNVTYIRILRIVRMARILRIIRVMRFFRSLRLMVYSIIHSLLSLLWVFLLLFFTMYVFSIFILNAVTTHFNEKALVQAAESESDLVLINAFGSLFDSLNALFQTICGGRSWYELYEPLYKANWVCGVVFVFYIFFVVFGVLNVVTGAFVDSMRQVSEKDHDHVVEAEMKRMDLLKKDIRKVFDEADNDSSGSLSWEEFEAHLEDERVRAYFRTLEIDVSQARALFVLLDMDESDEVPIERFVDGCMRMRGDAKSIDVNMLLYENEKMLMKITSFIEYAEEKFEGIEMKLARVSDEVIGADASTPSKYAKRRQSFSVQVAERRKSHSVNNRSDMGLLLFGTPDACARRTGSKDRCDNVSDSSHDTAGGSKQWISRGSDGPSQLCLAKGGHAPQDDSETEPRSDKLLSTSSRLSSRKSVRVAPEDYVSPTRVSKQKSETQPTGRHRRASAEERSERQDRVEGFRKMKSHSSHQLGSAGGDDEAVSHVASARTNFGKININMWTKAAVF